MKELDFEPPTDEELTEAARRAQELLVPEYQVIFVDNDQMTGESTLNQRIAEMRNMQFEPIPESLRSHVGGQGSTVWTLMFRKKL